MSENAEEGEANEPRWQAFISLFCVGEQNGRATPIDGITIFRHETARTSAA